MTAYTASLLEAGIAEGEEKLSRLLQQLLSLGRTDDVAKAISDEEARKALYKEFGMNDKSLHTPIEISKPESKVSSMREWLDLFEKRNQDEGRFEERFCTLQALLRVGFSLDDKVMITLRVTEDEYKKVKERLYIDVNVIKREGSENNNCKWLDSVEEKNQAEGRTKERLCTLQKLIQAGFSLEDKAMVALKVTEEEYAAAKESLPAVGLQYKPEVLEAMEEAERISGDANTKRYSSFSEAMEEVTSEA